MTKPVPNVPARKALWVVLFHNLGRKPGIQVGIGNKDRIKDRINAYTAKIMRRHVFHDFKLVSRVSAIHTIEGQQDELLAIRKKLMEDNTTCPCCGVKLLELRHDINSPELECTCSPTRMAR